MFSLRQQCKIIMEYHDVLEASRNTGTDPATETWCCINNINFNTLDNGKSPQRLKFSQEYPVQNHPISLTSSNLLNNLQYFERKNYVFSFQLFILPPTRLPPPPGSLLDGCRFCLRNAVFY